MALIIRSESNIAESRLHGSSNPIKVLGTLHCSSHLFPTKLESNTSKIPSEGSLTSGRGSQGLKLSSHTVFVAVRDRILSRKHRQEHGDTLIGKNSLHTSVAIPSQYLETSSPKSCFCLTQSWSLITQKEGGFFGGSPRTIFTKHLRSKCGVCVSTFT